MSSQDAPDFGLDRFVEAQNPVWPHVITELGAGRKRTHWMWFVFPQIAGLGRSPVARHYAINSRREAEAYLAHVELRSRLIAATRLTTSHSEISLGEIFGSPDDLKFRSSMTLFAAVADDGDDTIFGETLRAWSLDPDQATLDLLARAP